MAKKKNVRYKARYIGGGFVPGIPARDLTAEEVEFYGGVEVLSVSRIYEFEEEKQEVTNGDESSDENPVWS